jgi:hypothetical protein
MELSKLVVRYSLRRNHFQIFDSRKYQIRLTIRFFGLGLGPSLVMPAVAATWMQCWLATILEVTWIGNVKHQYAIGTTAYVGTLIGALADAVEYVKEKLSSFVESVE